MLYARQVPYEYQTSPLEFDNYDTTIAYPDVAIYGNRYYTNHIPDYMEKVWDALDDVAEAIADIDTQWSNYDTITEAINHLLQPVRKLSTHKIHRLKEIFQGENGYYDDDENVAEILSIVLDKPFETGTIRGCCQSDWMNVIYPVGMDLDALETEYFNTGTEWCVAMTDEEIEDANDVDLADTEYAYLYTCDEKKELAAIYGVDGENVVLFTYKGMAYYPTWNVAS